MSESLERLVPTVGGVNGPPVSLSRVRRLCITRQFFGRLIETLASPGFSSCRILDVPEDLQVGDAMYDAYYDWWQIKVYSESFGEVRPGDLIPYWIPTVATEMKEEAPRCSVCGALPPPSGFTVDIQAGTGRTTRYCRGCWDLIGEKQSAEATHG